MMHMDAPEEGGYKLARKRKERSDGRVCVQFRFNGKRYTAYGETSKLAEQAAELMKAQLMTGTYESTRDRKRREREEAEAQKKQSFVKMPTFSEYSNEWLEQKRDIKLKETTLRSNRIMLNLINNIEIDNCKFGDMLLDRVTRRDVRQLQGALCKKASTRTTNDAISTVRAIYRHAIADRVVTWNPADNVKAVKRTEERAADTYHRALTKQETTEFLSYAKAMESRYYNLYVLLLHTGLRVGEAAALFNKDIDDEGITVVRTVTRTESGGYMIGTDTKTEAGRRFVPLDPVAKAALKDQQTLNRALYPSKVIAIQRPIFRAAKGGTLHASIINRDITRICERAGIEKFTAHAFRDTFATRAIESGVEVKELQSIMGHRDISMTLGLYAHTSRERKIEQLLAVNFM
jgi:integrase